MITLPNDFPVLERKAVRVVAQDNEGNVLLLRTRDATDPDLGDWWELPGGGIDNDETYLEAALREFREEVGIVVAAAQVGPPLWCRSASFRYRGRRRLQQEVIVRIAIEARKPAIGYAERLDYEIEDHFDYRWWSVADIQKSKERFYPGKLPVLLSPFLTGAKIDEPFELWS